MKGLLDADGLQRGLELAGYIPTRRDWAKFIDTLLAYLGSALVLAGIIFYFAYNWADMDKFTKFGLIACAIVLAVVVVAVKGLESRSGKTALIAAAVLPGALLTVYGQTYQTGADAYGVFLAWTTLIAGWVVISRFTALWMLWLVLANLALVLYWGERVNPDLVLSAGLLRSLVPWLGITYLLTDAALGELLFTFNVTALILYEWYARRGTEWLDDRWMPRLIACLALGALIVPTLIFTFEADVLSGENTALKLVPLFYVIASISILTFYHMRGRDLFILAMTYLGIIIVITAAIGERIGEKFGGYVFLSLLVIGLATATVALLRRTAHAWEQRT